VIPTQRGRGLFLSLCIRQLSGSLLTMSNVGICCILYNQSTIVYVFHLHQIMVLLGVLYMYMVSTDHSRSSQRRKAKTMSRRWGYVIEHKLLQSNGISKL